MATERSKLAFRIRRLMGFLRLLMSKKKSAFGLTLVVLFVAVALAAPVLAPYNELGVRPSDPLLPVGAANVPPIWFRHLPEGLGGDPSLSDTMMVVQEPGLPKLIEDQGEWNFSVIQGEGVSTPTVDLEVNFPHDAPPGFRGTTEQGSLMIRFSREAGAAFRNGTTIRLFKEFDYPYGGPTGRFMGNIYLLVNGSTHPTTITERRPPTYKLLNYTEEFLDVPVIVKVFLGRVGDKEWKLWPTPKVPEMNLFPPLGFALDDETSQPWGINQPLSGYDQGWILSRESYATKAGHIDSRTNALVNRLTEFGEQSRPDKMIFTEPGKYVYGVEFIFLDQKDNTKPVETTIHIDDFGLLLYGTAFGLMGTDHHGRDLFSQLIYGTRISLYLGITVAVLGVTLGLIVGLAAGYMGRIVDEILMRVADVLLVLPGLPLLIVLVAVLGASIENLIFLLAFLGWMGFARLVRSQVLSVKERPFVEAAKAVGAGRFHIIVNHILPSVMSLVYISLATSVPGAVTAEAALAWLGFYDPNRMSWGRMLNGVFEAKAITSWWWVVPPGLAISLLAASFILLGYALDEVLNPKLRLRK